MNGLDMSEHPPRSAWAYLYAAALVMGVLYLTDFAETKSLAGATDSLAAYTWQWTLTLGGVAGLVGNLAPRRWYRYVLTLEAAGALSVGAMAAIYVSAIAFAPSTTNPPWATIVWMTAIVAVLAGRFVETFHQRRNAIEHAEARRVVAVINEGR